MSSNAPAPDLFGPRDPEGFSYRDNVLLESEEGEYLRLFAELPFQPFEFQGYLGNRRIVSYGFRYDYAARELRAAEEMPAFLKPLRDAAASFSGIPQGELRQALVTEYAPGTGIGWHKDKPMFDKIVALSFAAPCVLRMRRPLVKGWERHRAMIAPRSCYVLSGEVREDWQHSIAPMNTLRYSVTFRSFRPG